MVSDLSFPTNDRISTSDWICLYVRHGPQESVGPSPGDRLDHLLAAVSQETGRGVDRLAICPNVDSVLTAMVIQPEKRHQAPQGIF